jgi:hypothetical protein
VRTSEPDVPVIVNPYVPRGASLATAIVKIEVAVCPAGGITTVGLKDGVTPEGQFDMLNVTAELKLLIESTLTVVVLDSPWAIVKVVGLTDIEKSTATSVILSRCVIPPPEPTTVN